MLGGLLKAIHEPVYEHRLDVLAELITAHLQAGDRLLDIGCGSGRHTAAAYQLPLATVIGIDLNRSDLADAGKRLALHDRLSAHGSGTWGLLAAAAALLSLPLGCAGSYDDDYYQRRTPHYEPYPNAPYGGYGPYGGRYGGYGRYGRYGRY